MAEVLQSAEAMKAAVSHLEKFMEKSSDSRKGKVILATVKGDVHDIGKNLVEIILSNNGYEVVNLGIKVPPERLIEAYREHRPDLIGLSGLLVKSAQQMVTTAKDLTASGVAAPMLVGGAALSQKFTDQQIAPAYGGLAVVRAGRDAGPRARRPDPVRGERAGSAVGGSRRAPPGHGGRAPHRTGRRTRSRRRRCGARTSTVVAAAARAGPRRSTSCRSSTWRRSGSTSTRTCSTPSTSACAGSYRKLKEAGDPKLAELEARHRRRQARRLDPRARDVPLLPGAYSEGNTLHLVRGDRQARELHVPAAGRGERLCLSDFVGPLPTAAAATAIALLITTAGEGIRARAEELKNRGEYLLCHALQALAVETAEAAGGVDPPRDPRGAGAFPTRPRSR